MADSSDSELLAGYRQGAEDAFAELVRRHIHLVYSCALRHVSVAAHAEEISQTVFISLSRKAAGLRPGTVLEGWLYETTRLTALSFMRRERRRQRREQEAMMQSRFEDSGQGSVWSQLAPLLDEAIVRLKPKDRDAIILRFFKGQNLNEVAAALKISEAAAQSRVHRAVGKLQHFFQTRGVHSTAAAVTAAISANSVQAAPAALIKTTTAVALIKGAAAPGSTLTLIHGALKIMAWTKTQTLIVSAVVIGALTYSIAQHHAASGLRARNESLQRQLDDLSRLKAENEALSNQLAAANRAGAEARPGLDFRQHAPNSPVQAAAAAPIQPAAPAAPALVELPKSSWTNAGFATPEAALQTRGAAVLAGDRELFKQSIFIPDDARKFAEDALIKMAEASKDPDKAKYIQQILDNKLGVDEAILMPMMALNQNGGLEGYKILSEQPVSPNEKILQVETDQVSAGPQTDTLDFQLIDGNWRIVYDKSILEKMIPH